MEKATFAAGCFWGVEEAFDGVKGVDSTRVGYAGGNKPNPTYKNVCSGDTGHAEVVEILFDPKKISYEELLKIFWKIHDPTTVNRQGPDVGTQYRSAIFTHSSEQEKIAKASKEKIASQYDQPIVTQILPATTFYEAEEYHQKYFKKH
ncbi:MAG: peptide-methionine (S)-S-oxide reductase MsrA [Chlamydiales bacterium]|nr:peptide-methionine (S)-S-oxide reductase MsrA [Chlamydiia bacterium]MCP5505081.1 peptide-methionine (S)-S-oxide reductase MsrA [Chlamydiales bacterium]